MVLIAIDNFLGVDHHMYGEFPCIYARNGIETAVERAGRIFCKNHIAFPEDRTFLAQMIYSGKIQFLKQ